MSEINLMGATDDDMVRISEETGIGLSLEEMHRVKNYFANKKRNPTDIELQAIGQAWSEHCCYKSSKPILERFIFNIKAPQNILLGEDAGVVEFDEKHAYVVAFESHNHPSAVEPYGGASTGIGGILRDVTCMNAQPVALIDSLFFGSLDFPYEELPKGVKHPKYLFNGVVSGISDYGNRVGIPTCAGMVYFDDGYVENCLVNVGCVGIVRKNKIVRSKAKPGDNLILVGGKTGRDGIHGVTFASAELTEESEESRTAVQLGDPITKEPLIHACLEATERNLVNGMKDLGGGGLSCATSEMCQSHGAEIFLDEVPLKVKAMRPWEIWVSESQERMMLSVDKEDVDEVIKIFSNWDVDATYIGNVTRERVLRVFYRDEKVFEMDSDFLMHTPVYHHPRESRGVTKKAHVMKEPADYNEELLRILSSYNISSRESIIRQYDYEVRGNTVIKPLHGASGKETHGDATVIKPLEHSYRGLAITSDVNPAYMKINPFWGAASAIDEVCRNLCAVGARPHSFADCLNFGSPERKEIMGDFHECCRGLNYMASSLGIPFVSGNVSFYNELRKAIPPTPTILGVGIVPDIRKCVTSDVKKRDNSLYVIGETKPELGKSPRVDPIILKRRMEALLAAIELGYVQACHDISDGGIAVSVSEMLIGGNLGADLDISAIEPMRSDYKLFSESNARWIAEIEVGREEEFESIMSDITLHEIGKLGGKRLRICDGAMELIDLSISEIRGAWEGKMK